MASRHNGQLVRRRESVEDAAVKASSVTEQRAHLLSGDVGFALVMPPDEPETERDKLC